MRYKNRGKVKLVSKEPLLIQFKQEIDTLDYRSSQIVLGERKKYTHIPFSKRPFESI